LQGFGPQVRFGLLPLNQRVTQRPEADGIVSRTVGRGDADVPAQQLFSHLATSGPADWTPQRLAWVGTFMAWDEGQTLTARFEHACQAAHDLHRHWTVGTSYSGFTAAMLRWSPTLTAALKRRFQREMLRIAGPYWRRGRWTALAADGTRIEAPHTVANETDLGCAGKDKTAPQVFLTVLWHMGLGLPWDYRLGPGTASERTHLKRMVPELPAEALVVADAGFVGYGLCLRLLRHGAHFLLRVGGNITLLTGLGYYHEERDGLVYLWPQRHRRCRPLVLRLIVLRHGKQDVSLLTDVLDPAQLTDAEAATLFGMRWGEEICQADCTSRLRLFASARSPHSGRGGVAGAGPVGPTTPASGPGATAMRRDADRAVPPRPHPARVAVSA
jgi:hypothetical protein